MSDPNPNANPPSAEAASSPNHQPEPADAVLQATLILTRTDWMAATWPEPPQVDPAAGPQLWLPDSGQVLALDFTRSKDLTLGRAPQAELSVASLDPANAVSRHHARLELFGHLVGLEDLGSTNGTWWSGGAVPINSCVPLRMGDPIVFGGLRAVFQVGSAWLEQHRDDVAFTQTLCAHCDQTTPALFRFCANCGKPLADPEPPPPPPASPPPQRMSGAPPGKPPTTPSIQISNILDDQPAAVDRLDFVSYSRALAELIGQPRTKTPVTFGIFGRWGTGKTTLMRMLAAELERSGTLTVWFNAWQYSREEELWAAFLQSLLLQIRGRLGLLRRLAFSLNLWRRRFKWAEAPEYFLSLLWRLAVVAAPLVVAGPIAQQVQQDLIQSLLQVAGGGGAVVLAAWVLVRPLVEAWRRDLTLDLNALRKDSDFEKRIAFLDRFREHFADVVSSLPLRGDKRLAVFIDDLDRCPTERVLQILDAVKLFVDLPGCVYVLGLDLDVVQQAISYKYKDDPVAQREYLGKIIQLPFQLPPLTRVEMREYVTEIARDLPDAHCRDVFVEGLSANPREIKRTLNIFALLWSLSKQRPALAELVKPVRLAKVVAIQHSYPELHRLLRERPGLLGELETAFKRLASQPGLTEGEDPIARLQALQVPPLLQAFVKDESLGRMLLLHVDTPGVEAGFAGLSLEAVAVYFTLAVQAEARLASVAAQSTTPSFEAVQPGTVLDDRFQVQSIIGRGGMSTVFQAFDLEVGRAVGLKVLEPTLAADVQFLRRFEMESHLSQRLEHPNVVRVYMAGRPGRFPPYYTMEFMPGGSLHDRLSHGPLPLDEVGRVFGAILDGLQYMHEAGAVHRDIKPRTILFSEKGVPKISDFGITKWTGAGLTTLTTSDVVIGTPLYMAPECGRGEPATIRSDLYSIGVTLYESLVGEPPYQADTLMAVLLKSITDPFPLLRTKAAHISPELEAFVLRLCAKEPGDRYESAGEAKEALLKALPTPGQPEAGTPAQLEVR